MEKINHTCWRTILVTLFCITCFFVNAQRTITGKVVDAVTGDPLMGVSIIETGTIKMTVSDFEGKFITQVKKDSITFAYAGFEIDTLKAQDQMVVQLIPNEYFIEEIIITDQRIERSRGIPVSLLTKTEIELTPPAAIMPVLNQVPGVFVHKGTINTNRVTIRGIGSRVRFGTAKIRAYIDDIPITDGNGDTGMDFIDKSLLSEVTVWKGPSASHLGGALGGVIQFKTDDFKNQSSKIFADFSYGSFDTRRVGVGTFLKDKTDKFSLLLKYHNMHSDGWRDNNELDRQGVFAIAKAKLNDAHQLKLLVNLATYKAFIPSGLNPDDYAEDPQQAAFIWRSVNGFEDVDRAQVALQHRYADGRFSWNTSLHTTYRKNEEMTPFNLLNEKSNGIGLRSRVQYELNDEFTVGGGTEFLAEGYNRNTLDVEDFMLTDILTNDRDHQRNRWDSFAEIRWAKNSSAGLFSELGLNLNTTFYELTNQLSNEPTRKNNYSPVLSPRLSVGYKFNRSVQIYSTISHGFNMPTVEETLDPDGQLNPDIAPETGWNFEIGTRSNQQRFSWDVALFSMLINDLLVDRRTAENEFIGLNAGRTRHTGLETYFSYWLKQNRWKLFSSYTYSDFTFTDFVDGDDDFTGNALPGVAPHVLQLGTSLHTWKNFYGQLDYNYISEMPLTDVNALLSEDYHVLNLKIGWTKQLNEKVNLRIAGGVLNLLDEQYASMIQINAPGSNPRYFYPGNPRNYFVETKVEYGF